MIPVKFSDIISNQKTIAQFIKYGFVGVISNSIGYLIYLLITYWGLKPKIAMSILYFFCATMSFFGNKEVTFLYKGSWIGSGTRFIIAHILGYFINFIILVICVDLLKYPHQIVQAFAIIIVAIYLFLTFKWFVFNNS